MRRIPHRLQPALLGLAFILIGSPSGAQVAPPPLRASDYGAAVSDRIRETLLAAETGDVMLGAKIMGGSEAVPGDDPWQAGLIIGRTPDEVRAPFCGGAVIAPQWVVTAAHCVDNGTSPQVVDVVTGSVDLATGRRSHVDLIVIHHGWTPGPRGAPTFRNDVALLHLSESVAATPIALATTADAPDLERAGALGRVTGWGKTSELGALQNRLRTLTIPVVAAADCNDRVAYGDRDPTTPPLMPEIMLCAGRADGGQDACQGDSGGPLTGSTADGRILVGVVSWGKGCGRRNKYGVYTRLSAFSDWITACINGGDCPRRQPGS